MTVPSGAGPPPRARDLLFVTTPALWPTWPFLPVVRRSRGALELGVMFDARGVCGMTGYSACVFACNVFALPRTLSEFLSLPREAHDTAEELLGNGWRVD